MDIVICILCSRRSSNCFPFALLIQEGGKEMKTCILKISALCLAIVLIVGVCWFANGLVGNPISKIMAHHSAVKYIETKYPNTDYVIEEVSYNFKDGGYYAHVISPYALLKISLFFFYIHRVILCKSALVPHQAYMPPSRVFLRFHILFLQHRVLL